MYVDSLRQQARSAMTAEMLNPETERRLLHAWCNNQDEQARERLIVAYIRLATSITKKYRQYGVSRSDLIQEARLGLIRAVDKFDPDRGLYFSLYARWWIQAALRDCVIRNWSLVNIGIGVRSKRLFFKLRAVQSRFEREAMARGETICADRLCEMIASELGVSVASVKTMQSRLAGPDYSLNAPVSTSGEGDEWIDMLIDEHPQGVDVWQKQHDRKQLRRWLIVALNSLPERDRYVVWQRIVLDTPRELACLGRELGVSGERVRQIEARAFTKMRVNLQTQSPEVRHVLT